MIFSASTFSLSSDLPVPKNRWEKICLFLATGGYLSLVPPKIETRLRQNPWFAYRMKASWTGSGIAGAFWGLVTFLILPTFIAGNFVSILIGTFLAIWNAQRAEQILGRHDDSRIVVDEWIGCWIAMVGIPPLHALPHHFGFGVLTAFVLFRVFDVYKVRWVRQLQDLPGGWGVVLDDVLAGLLANLCARVIIVFIGVL